MKKLLIIATAVVLVIGGCISSRLIDAPMPDFTFTTQTQK